MSNNINCDKRQREVKRTRDGTETEQHRCLEKSAQTHLQIVDLPTCTACPFNIPKKKCGERPEWADEYLGTQIIDGNDYNVMDDKAKGFKVPCPYRFNGETCQITGHKIDPKICAACDQETAEEVANLPQKMKNYANAIKRWIREGRPTRTDDEVKEIFEKYCKGCDLYDKETHACKKCGCAVSTDQAPLKNKLKMKTEVCPMGLWR